MRLCLGHPKVHFGTIVEGSWGRGGGREECTVGPPGSLTMYAGTLVLAVLGPGVAHRKLGRTRAFN